MAEEKKLTEEELLKKAEIPEKKAPKWHEFYGGKIETCLKCAVTSYGDFDIWYTPGVAEPAVGSLRILPSFSNIQISGIMWQWYRMVSGY